MGVHRRGHPGLDVRRDLLHGRPVDRGRGPGALARRRRLPADAAADAGRRPAAAALAHPGPAPDPAGRRPHRRPGHRGAQRRDRVPDGARRRLGRPARGGHDPGLPAQRPDPGRVRDRRAGRNRLAAGPHVDAAGHRDPDLLAGRLALPGAGGQRGLRVLQLVRRRLVDRADAGGRGGLAACRRRRGARGGHPADRDAAELRRGGAGGADLRLLRRAERPGGGPGRGGDGGRDGPADLHLPRQRTDAPGLTPGGASRRADRPAEPARADPRPGALRSPARTTSGRSCW